MTKKNDNAVWTLAEQSSGELKTVSYELLARGRRLAGKLGGPLASVLIGDKISDSALDSLIKRGADCVYSVQAEELKYFVCETYSRILLNLINEHKPAVFLAAATSTGRTLMPYTAVKIPTGLTADCTELDIEKDTGNLLQTRPAIGGNIMATIKTPDNRPQMATVRPKSSQPLPMDDSRRGTVVRVPFDAAFLDGRTQVEGHTAYESNMLGLDEADVVIAGGRGLKKGENFSLIKKLARNLNAAVGASRDAVDSGWISYPHQIGLSGKTISPKIYVGVGISGAIQHLAGIKTSETIVSINTDTDATLHKIADLAIVGDAFEVIPAIQKKLAERYGNKHDVI